MRDPQGNDPENGFRINRLSRTESTQSTEGTEGLGESDATHASSSVQPMQEIERADATEQMQTLEGVTDALASGSIDALTAQNHLIDQIVRSQLPATADAELIQQMSEQVRLLLENDPMLANLLQNS